MSDFVALVKAVAALGAVVTSLFTAYEIAVQRPGRAVTNDNVQQSYSALLQGCSACFTTLQEGDTCEQ